MKKRIGEIFLCFVCAFLMNATIYAKNDRLEQDVKQTMLRATHYMIENVSTNGGYVWYYLPDFSRRWGEMEA
ncbi:MAG: pectate lyase, partial [Dysgonamonadaceae bacterium]